MRAGKADPGGKGIASVLLEPFGCLVADKAIDVEFALAWCDGCPHIFVISRQCGGVRPVEAVCREKLYVVVGQENVPFVFGHDAFVKALVRVPGVKVHFADGCGASSGLRDDTRPGWHVIGQPVTIAEYAGHAGVLPAHDGRATRHAYGGGDNAVVKYHAFACQAVEVGGLYKVEAVTGQAVPTLLIGGD